MKVSLAWNDGGEDGQIWHAFFKFILQNLLVGWAVRV